MEVFEVLYHTGIICISDFLNPGRNLIGSHLHIWDTQPLQFIFVILYQTFSITKGRVDSASQIKVPSVHTLLPCINTIFFYVPYLGLGLRSQRWHPKFGFEFVGDER
jgi:hypothetical protein